MELDIWDLPGPRAFIQSLAGRIVSGSSVALLWPASAPSGFATALKAVDLRGRAVQVARGNADDVPIHVVYQAALGDVPDHSARTAKALARDERVHGIVVHVPHVEDRAVDSWNRFLREFADSSRSCPVGDRLSVILELRGRQAQSPPHADVALDVLRWDNCTGESDAYILAISRLRNRPTTSRRRAFAAVSASRLGIWDLELVDELLLLDDKNLARPHALLVDWAQRRGWGDAVTPRWETGSLQTVDGIPTHHSAYLAIKDVEALDRRLWSAHAGLFLPWIEERRISLLPKLQGLITFPVMTDDGPIDRIQDLSIGQLAWALRGTRADPTTLRTISRLRNARNLLAHLQPLTPELALHDDLIK